MRADRLVALLLLLQRRGRLTAAEAAIELEVSERTARRDLEALGMAGIPVYSVRGRGGGWWLAGGGRTDLSGLHEPEVRALFLLVGPSADASPELRTALRKLVGALPGELRRTAEAAAGSVVVDRTGWGRAPGGPPAPPHLDAVQQAVVDGRQVDLGYTARDGAGTTRRIHPLGLVVKNGTWYLVAGTDAGLRTFRVERIDSVTSREELVVRPAGFDLAGAWEAVTSELEARWTPVSARAAANVDALQLLHWVFGNRITIGSAGDDGRVEVQLRGDNLRSLAGEIAGFGDALEVVDPPEIRRTLVMIGTELRATYGA